MLIDSKTLTDIVGIALLAIVVGYQKLIYQKLIYQRRHKDPEPPAPISAPPAAQ